ncbi:MAG: T9SS type A sorting domain-containing protein, partial [Bacteroidota bacterium]|nr:T9SS type A sorting domain-containing protein [Bacteroidota bacterium]
PDCDDQCSGIGHSWQGLQELSGTWPYTFDHPSVYWTPYGVYLNDLCEGVHTIAMSDVNGCPGNMTLTIDGIATDQPAIIATSPTCETVSDGSITLDLQGPGTDWIWITGTGLDSIYSFPDAPYVITGLAAGTYQVLHWDNQEDEIAYCTVATEVVIEEIQCGGISGLLFHDSDQDCAFNNNDIALSNRVLLIGPNEIYVITDSAGNFERALPLGTYTIQQNLEGLEQICPPDEPVSFSLTEQMPLVLIDLADSSTVGHDVDIMMWSFAARPGFLTTVEIVIYNNSAYPTGDLIVDLQYDPLLIEVVPADAQWSMTGLAPFQDQLFTFEAMVPANIDLLGTELSYTAVVTNTEPEPDLSNNTVSASQIITASYDPNDKTGTANASSSATQFYLDSDEWIDYTIRFQNTGTDTAFTVVIRDTLDLDLDIMSLDILGSSHSFSPSFEEGRTLAFTFNDIQLPDSTTDLLGSQGFISYRIKPVNTSMVSDVIENNAGIYFDFNSPIITNTTAHVIESTIGIFEEDQRVLLLMPNPAMDMLRIMSTATTVGWPQVLALDGRVIDVQVKRSGSGFDLGVGGISPGTYLVRIQDEHGISTGRFVKQ